MRLVAVLAVVLTLAIVAACGAARLGRFEQAGPPAGLTSQGRLLWNFEALLHKTFKTRVVSVSSGLYDSLNFSCAGWCGPNAKYLHYKFTFADARPTTLHVS